MKAIDQYVTFADAERSAQEEWVRDRFERFLQCVSENPGTEETRDFRWVYDGPCSILPNSGVHLPTSPFVSYMYGIPPPDDM